MATASEGSWPGSPPRARPVDAGLAGSPPPPPPPPPPAASDAAVPFSPLAFTGVDTAPDEPETWTQLPSCDAFVGPARSKHSAVGFGGGVVVFGGDDGRKMLTDLLRFDTQEHSWSRYGGRRARGRLHPRGGPLTCPPVARIAVSGHGPSPRYHHSAVVHGNNMIVFGAFTLSLSAAHAFAFGAGTHPPTAWGC